MTDAANSINYKRFAIVFLIFASVLLILLNKMIEIHSNGSAKISVLFSGCDFVLVNEQCIVYKNKQVKFWIANESKSNIKTTLINRGTNAKQHHALIYLTNQLAQKNEPTSNGTLFAFDGDIGDYQLEVSTLNGKGDYTLNISVIERPSWMDEVNLLSSNSKALDFLIAQKGHNKQVNYSSGMLDYQLARTYLSLNRIDDALDAINHSNQVFEKLLVTNKLVDNLTFTVYISLFLQDNIIQAKQIIDQLKFSARDADATFYYLFYSASMHSYAGELRQADKLFVQAKAIAKNLSMQKEYIDTQHMHSWVLVESGSHQLAIDIRSELVASLPIDWSDCRKAKFHNGLGWAKLRLLESSMNNTSDLHVPLVDFTQALALLTRSCPENVSDQLNILINIAKNYLLLNDIEKVTIQLKAIELIDQDLSYIQNIELTEIKGLLALQNNQPDLAQATFESQLLSADQLSYSNFKLSALVGLARSFQMHKKYDKALDYFAKAESLVFSNALSVPITGSQENFLDSNLNFSFQYVELLYQLGKIEQALDVARKFRAFWLISSYRLNQWVDGSLISDPQWMHLISEMKQLRKQIIAQQSLEWSLPFDQLESARQQLAELKQKLTLTFEQSLQLVNTKSMSLTKGLGIPNEKEVYMFFYPATQGWIGFVQDMNSIQALHIDAEQLDVSSVPELLSIWFEHFSILIDGKERIKVFPFGKMKSVNFNELALNQESVLANKQIVYGVDIKRDKTVNNKFKLRSLVVANSLGDLKSAEREASQVIKLFEKSKWKTTALFNKEATMLQLINNLSQVSLFHYAGHVVSSNTGIAEHKMPLAGNTELNARDILLLERAPRWAILSACNSSDSRLTNSFDSIGLAQAFVISGSEFVIATDQPVKDQIAEEFMTRFYQHWLVTSDFLKAVKQTQMELINEQPNADWFAFRVITI